MAAHSRYRVEGGEHCIDVLLTSVDQLFDLRDPAPFRERDLEPDLIEYVYAAAEDVVPHGPFKVVLWFPDRPDEERITSAYRSHFQYELERVDRRRWRVRRDGQLALLIAIPVLVAFLTLAHWASNLPAIGTVLAEGITIASWVVMWRPMETLIFDWIPYRRERKLYTLLRDAHMEVRAGTPPYREAEVYKR